MPGAAQAIRTNRARSRVAHPSPKKRAVVSGRTTPKKNLKPAERNLEVGPLMTIGSPNVG